MSKTNDFNKRAIRHGEVLLLPVTELPETVTEVFSGKNYVVAHSETGHDHVAVGDVRVFQSGNDFFLEAVRKSRIEHRKTFEKHETKTIFKGLYKITIKQAYDYFAKRMANVQD